MTPPVAQEAPFFVVGCPRSGTTLVRWMLREHPRLAIPTESPWLVEVAPRHGRWSPRRQARTLDAIVHHPRYWEWPRSEEEARAAVARRRPSSYAELVAALFEDYAEHRGKPRWGDKTPEHVLHVELIAGLFPDAVFVHVIRDGRVTAASLADQHWAKPGLVGKAYYWRDCVTAGRRAGQRLGSARYCEVRLEDLVADPEGQLTRVCAAIGESYTPRLLEYTARSAEVDSFPPEKWPSFQHLAKPPTAGLRDWEAGVSRDDRDAVTRICQPLLRELGYER